MFQARTQHNNNSYSSELRDSIWRCKPYSTLCTVAGRHMSLSITSLNSIARKPQVRRYVSPNEIQGFWKELGHRGGTQYATLTTRYRECFLECSQLIVSQPLFHRKQMFSLQHSVHSGKPRFCELADRTLVTNYYQHCCHIACCYEPKKQSD